MTQTQQWDESYIAHTYSRFPITLVEGKGSILKDDQGNRYIDLGSRFPMDRSGMPTDAKAIPHIQLVLHPAGTTTGKNVV